MVPVVLLCLGDSHTQCQYGGNWITSLQSALGPKVRIVNRGKNGCLAWNVLQTFRASLDACGELPVAITLLVGTNDAMMSLADDANETFGKRVYRWMNGYSGPSGVAAYREALGQVLTEFTAELRARRQKLGLEKTPPVKLLLMTLPPLGEVLGDRHNTRINQFNTALREAVAAHTKQEAAKGEANPALSVAVVELHRACADAIETADAQRPTGQAKARGVGSTVFYAMCDIVTCDVRKNVWGLAYDRQSRDAGLAVLCPDRIHINDSGAGLLAGLLSTHLQALMPKE